MEMKSGYKQTDIGNIPEDWDSVPSSDLAAFFGGNAFKGDAAVGHGVKWLKIANVGKQRVVWDAPSFLPANYVDDFESYVLRPGDVVMALTRPILDDELKIAKLSKADAPALLNQRLAKVIASSRADINFIYHVLQTKFFVASMKDAMAGSDPPNIGSRTLGGILVAVPRSLQEQRAIATALSDVDALIAGLEQLIAKKRDLKQAAMQQLLNGQTRLPGFSGEWVPRPLGALGATYGGLVGKSKANFGQGPARYVPFVNVMANIRIDCGALEPVDVASTENQNRVLSGDLLFNGSSETPEEVALCALMTESVEDLYLNSFCFGFRLKQGADASGLFLTYLMRSQMGRELMKSLAQGSTRYNLSKSALLQATLVLPGLEEQAAIATVLYNMDADLAALESRLAKTRAIKQGMMQELLTGRIRLLEKK